MTPTLIFVLIAGFIVLAGIIFGKVLQYIRRRVENSNKKLQSNIEEYGKTKTKINGASRDRNSGDPK